MTRDNEISKIGEVIDVLNYIIISLGVDTDQSGNSLDIEKVKHILNILSMSLKATRGASNSSVTSSNRTMCNLCILG